MQLAMKASYAPRRQNVMCCCACSKQKSSIALGAVKAGVTLIVARNVTTATSTHFGFTFFSSERTEPLSSHSAMMSSGASLPPFFSRSLPAVALRQPPHPNGQSRPRADCIVCSDLMACTYSVRRFLGLSLPHSSNRPSFASRSEANLSHVLARSDHIFLASGSFAVCAMRTQSSAC
jgi:hypothetical protein